MLGREITETLLNGGRARRRERRPYIYAVIEGGLHEASGKVTWNIQVQLCLCLLTDTLPPLYFWLRLK